MNLARWRDGEMARWEERDSEMDFFTKRKRVWFTKRKRGKECNPNKAVKTDGSIISTAL